MVRPGQPACAIAHAGFLLHQAEGDIHRRIARVVRLRPGVTCSDPPRIQGAVRSPLRHGSGMAHAAEKAAAEQHHNANVRPDRVELACAASCRRTLTRRG